MAPVKFGDLAKSAAEILDDDYQTEGYQFKGKKATTFDGASATTAIDLWGKDSVKTPAKITWKFPKPFGIAGVSIDKLEMNKSGDFAGEFAFGEGLHQVKNLAVSAKTDFRSMDKATVGCTYTGVADTRVQLDTKMTNPSDFTCEVTRSIVQFTAGAKLSKKDMMPNLGIRFTSDPVFAALVASDQFKKFKFYSMCQVNKDVKVAGMCEYNLPDKKGAVGATKASLSVATSHGSLGKVKAKVAQDGTASFSLKKAISKGFTCLVGAKYNYQTHTTSYGCQLSIE